MGSDTSAKQRIQRNVLIVIGLLTTITAIVFAYRMHTLNYQFDGVLPKRVFTVTVKQSFVGHGMPVELSTYLPQSEFRQKVVNEYSDSDGLRYEVFSEDQNKRARWRSDRISDERTVRISFQIITEAIRYTVDKTMTIADATAVGNKLFLEETEVIQTNSPEIRRAVRQRIPADGTVLSFLRNVYSFVSGFSYKPFKGTTDALTALRLGEASCNGRSRLMVAMLRSQGIEARLVGGLVMTSGEKKTSHQWVEAHIGNTWVPIDPTNGHFLEIPNHYLVLYRGDQVLFSHTSDIGFKYEFAISNKMVPSQEVSEEKQFMGFTHIFRELGIPIELLKSIIMIPLGALIVVLFRNVIGLQTFGTFLPALIAVACRNTGLFWGLVGFTMIIAVVSLMRHSLAKLQLLHSPQLGVMLTVVIVLLLAFAVLGQTFHISGIAKMSLFPMVIVAVTSERFSIMEIEEGRIKAWKTMGQTLVVVSMAYLVMSSLSLQIIMLGFPELLLVVVALNIWIGRWVGLRASEWIRFKGLIWHSRKGESA